MGAAAGSAGPCAPRRRCSARCRARPPPPGGPRSATTNAHCPSAPSAEGFQFTRMGCVATVAGLRRMGGERYGRAVRTGDRVRRWAQARRARAAGSLFLRAGGGQLGFARGQWARRSSDWEGGAGGCAGGAGPERAAPSRAERRQPGFAGAGGRVWGRWESLVEARCRAEGPQSTRSNPSTFARGGGVGAAAGWGLGGAARACHANTPR
jgi:hypothetical protein